ncbi:MAG TPA: prolipoprotein diacylglyceryl transferase [Anaerolineae bacterium]|nr:prolipoprotein diacylglyceryl transferase [Anaerolineae bacterium]
MSPIAFRIGPLTIYWYGLLITVGVLAGGYVATLEARRRGQNADHVWNGLILCLIFGLIGARLYHVISSPAGGVGWSYYRQHPLDIIAFWKGGLRGLGIYGAIVGGIAAVYLYARLNRLDVLTWLDIGAPGLILGQAIGRWGNFFNQELYGYPTDLPWGIPIDPAYRLEQFRSLPPDARFHPTFFYEFLWNLLVFAVLMAVGRRYADRLLRGDIILLYAILYPLGRFFIEYQRPDAWTVGGVAVAQLLAVVSIVLSGAIMAYRHRRRATPAES